MKSAPRISIVTPSFNQANFLNDTLNSVCEQGYPNLEYVVIDGGSTDGSVEIIRRYESAIHYWCSEPDSGHADAINKGFERTTGEIMAWINSSDIYYPWTFKVVADIFNELPEVEWISGLGSTAHVEPYPRFVCPNFCTRYDLLSNSIGVIQQESVFWRRSLWERAGGTLDTQQRLACDYELWVRFSRHAPLCHVSTPLAAFRFHEDSRSQTQRAQYDWEMRLVRDAERAKLSKREQRNLALVNKARRYGGRYAPALLARSSRAPWYTYSCVDYSFEERRWRLS